MKRTNRRGRARPKGPSGTERAARSCVVASRALTKRIEALLGPEAAAALIDLRKRTGRTYSAIIEGLLLAEHAKDARRVDGLRPKAPGALVSRLPRPARLPSLGDTKGNRKEAERPPC
jgi:hypothetical protein